MITALLIIIAVLLFALIIFVHEFGHFITAKLCGIRVNEFALGMGPKIFKKQGKETLYTLRLFPIGGFCAIEGEDGDSEDERSFNKKPIWQRMLVIIAGAVMNIILGLILMCIVLCSQDLLGIPCIANFTETSKLQQAGAEVGDYFVSINGYKIYTERDLSFALATANPDDVDIVLNRQGKEITLDSVKLDSAEIMEGRRSVQLDFGIYGVEKSFGNVAKKTFLDTYSIARSVYATLGGLFTGQFGFNDLSGPVGVAQVITEAAGEGLKTGFMDAVNNIITIMVLITVNLGIFNLIPFPALDGGRFLFLLIELITRKKIPEKVEGYINAAGFAILILLMIVVAFKDVFTIIF
ncbi:MAG: site-2 protease family protein [Ruminococcaceae bacterium]|nr:site-2 protease family protein [Oscillospiraceae bacterium]